MRGLCSGSAHGCVVLGKVLNLSGPSFLIPQRRSFCLAAEKVLHWTREMESLTLGLGLWLKRVPPCHTHSSFPKRTSWVVSDFTVTVQSPVLHESPEVSGKTKGGLSGLGCVSLHLWHVTSPLRA